MRKIIIIFIFFLTSAYFVQAGYVPLESLPGMSEGEEIENLPKYLEKLLPIFISMAGILAVVVIVIAGLMYVTAAGNAGRVEKARGMIWSAIGGLLLIISSWLILNTINPDLVKLDLGIRPLEIEAPETPGASCTQGDCPAECEQENGGCSSTELWDSNNCECSAFVW